MPRRVAKSRSMLSTPTPARPSTFSFLPASMTSAATLVRLRTMRASYASMIERSSCAPIPPRASTTSPGVRLKISIPSAAMSSASNTRIRMRGSFMLTSIPYSFDHARQSVQ